MPQLIAATFCLIGSVAELAVFKQPVDRQPQREPTRPRSRQCGCRSRPGSRRSRSPICRSPSQLACRSPSAASARSAAGFPASATDCLTFGRLGASRVNACVARGSMPYFAGHPAFALAATERRHALIDRSRDENLRGGRIRSGTNPRRASKSRASIEIGRIWSGARAGGSKWGCPYDGKARM